MTHTRPLARQTLWAACAECSGVRASPSRQRLRHRSVDGVTRPSSAKAYTA